MENDSTIAMAEIGRDPKLYRELRLPAGLCEKLEQRLRGSRFATVEEFLTFVMREIVSSDSSEIESQEREMLERRLRDLGYM